MKKVLIVGAGAVGQAYGFHLQQGGAQVGFWVREKYRSATQEGFAVSCLNGPQEGTHHLKGDFVCCTLEEVSKVSWTEVWLCVSSPALRGEWLDELLSSVGDATIIMLQPGLNDRERVRRAMKHDKLVHGLITLVSFQAPLGTNESVDQRMTWWFPPFSDAPFEGTTELVKPICQTLRQGGMGAKRTNSLDIQLRFGSGVLMPFIGVLEQCAWRFDSLSDRPNRTLAARAIAEALHVSLPAPKPILTFLVSRPSILGFLIWLAPRFTPFDLELMLRSHFVKVGAQTRELLNGYLVLAREQGVTVPALTELAEALAVQTQ